MSRQRERRVSPKCRMATVAGRRTATRNVSSGRPVRTRHLPAIRDGQILSGSSGVLQFVDALAALTLVLLGGSLQDLAKCPGERAMLITRRVNRSRMRSTNAIARSRQTGG